MSIVAIRVDPAGFDKMLAQIGMLQVAVPKAIAQGLNEGGDKVRTQVMRALWKQTGLTKYKSVTSRVRTSRAFAEGDRGVFGSDRVAEARSQTAALTYQIIVPGKPLIPITEWPVTVRTGPGGGIDAKTWGVDHLFKRSFQEANGALRARTSASRYPVRKLWGPNLAKEVERGVIPSVFVFTTHDYVGPAILKRLARLL